MVVAFEKYHGTGNDFLICGADEAVDWGAFAIEHCDRETGIEVDGRRGADGVLVLSLSGERVRMRLYQPDGGTAAMCGNGARCAAQWAARRLRRLDTRERPEAASGAGGIGADEFAIDTPAGERRARVGEDTIEIEMGVPSFEPADVPLAREEPLIREDVEGWEVTALNTGVPHAVVFVDDVSTTDLGAMAPPIRHAEVFPEGANVNLASPSERGFDQRTFERGVEGETRSCGTGAVAIAAVAKRIGLVEGDRVSVSPPGGDLDVRVPDDGPAVLSGPVEFEGRGEVSP
ncbi:diaminopimelate epimerase [Halalkalicoccus jeotgali]|uniref:Diaminopimelate epimerase n=1 Tax=Halalkalicoccus jeotgali (strain DSM 18796 / CECT 7217 / JCM 14584 / KCTC 4019 / B3) TaxID=795797 RepID=D8J895_HALJB|nr:diaminopimelate epimerase [Halalkalicoccus jeotgali]ADJ16141.1 diaminopimelate epimerase [Halalkalicoccus jeotgali B3]ELY37570.1 diaminopimelate epimerase [Halalkalicoccus jeotgali B3]